MLTRSSRRFAILFLITFFFSLALFQHRLWEVHKQVVETRSHFELRGTSTETVLMDWPDQNGAQGYRGHSWQHAVKPDSVHENPMVDTTRADDLINRPDSIITRTSKPGVPIPSSTWHLTPPTPRSSNMKEYVKAMLNWSRPTWDGHWPPYQDYVNKGYDPNRWEKFDMDNRFYDSKHDKLNNSVASHPVPYNPLPKYNTPEWQRIWKGKYLACIGPRGLYLNESSDDAVQAYPGVPIGFPPVYTGGYDVIDLDENVCFDRYSRYGPYGWGDDIFFPSNVAKDWNAPELIPNWTKVRWGELQNNCLERNKNRYRPEARTSIAKTPSTIALEAATASLAFASKTITIQSKVKDHEYSEQRYHHRTAVLIRTWTGYIYEENDIMAIRAMISELSLQSGGEYQVFLFVHVKDNSVPIFNDQGEYEKILTENIPEELRDIAILWSESIFPSWYPNVMNWQVYWQQFMCLQWFSLTHPEFDYIWNWEIDARYTGHHYHFFEKIGEFSAKQPRKLLWERNKRYYIPSIHGDYESFIRQTHDDVLNASSHSLISPPVWGPRPCKTAQPPQKPLGYAPPTSFEVDNFEWGVNEPADLITLLPMWDPRNTTWSYKDKIWNYIPNVRPIFTEEDDHADSFTHPDFAYIDRRVFINTVVRLSKRMLQAMHEENLAGRSMQAEMWPSTVALQHGLKAVYAPHPIFTDRHWPAPYSAAIFDTASSVDSDTGAANHSRQGAWTEEADSPYNHDREYNFAGWSWYFASNFPRNLYRRWLGMPIVKQEWAKAEQLEGGEGADGLHEEKRMCIPGILLHPVKSMHRDRVRL